MFLGWGLHIPHSLKKLKSESQPPPSAADNKEPKNKSSALQAAFQIRSLTSQCYYFGSNIQETLHSYLPAFPQGTRKIPCHNPSMLVHNNRRFTDESILVFIILWISLGHSLLIWFIPTSGFFQQWCIISLCIPVFQRHYKGIIVHVILVYLKWRQTYLCSDKPSQPLMPIICNQKQVHSTGLGWEEVLVLNEWKEEWMIHNEPNQILWHPTSLWDTSWTSVAHTVPLGLWGRREHSIPAW